MMTEKSAVVDVDDTFQDQLYGLKFFAFLVLWSFFQSSGFLLSWSSGFGLRTQLIF